MIHCIVAEDFEELRNIYSSLLNSEADITVDGGAADGKGLFALMEESRPDVVLLDIEMDRPDAGIEYCGRIGRDYPGCAVVMLTCHEEEEMILAAFRAGAVDYILKTSSLSEIVEAVRFASQGRSRIHPHASRVLRKEMRRMEEDRDRMMDTVRIISSLTNSEAEILAYLLQGMKQKQIAEKRNVELPTVKTHITGIHRKFGCRRSQEVLSMIRASALEDLVRDRAQP